MSTRRTQRAVASGALLSPAVAFVLASAPTIAEACSVCMTGREDENRIAFLVTTVFLSLLPLAILGGVVYWIWRRMRDQSQEELHAEPRTMAPGDFAHRSISAES